MKSSWLLPVLIGSAALNLVLLRGILTLSNQGTTTRFRTASPATGSTEPKLDPAAWQTIYSEDLKTERDRLRAQGFPPNIIRALLAARIHANYAGRRQTIEAALAEVPFWKQAKNQNQINAQLSALNREEQRDLRKLVGAEPGTGAQARLVKSFPELPAEKVHDVAAVEARYNEQRQALTAKMGNVRTSDDNTQIRNLQATEQAELAAVMNPAELEMYNLRFSTTANSLRMNLSAFDPSEEEFRSIYNLKSTFDQNYNYSNGMTGNERKAYEDAWTQLNVQISSTLGQERYSDYQRSQDWGYQQSTQLVARLELPPETANALYALRQQYQVQSDILTYSNIPAGQDPEQVAQARREATQQEATARVIALFNGNVDAVEAYKQYGGSWLSNLAPRPATPGKN